MQANWIILSILGLLCLSTMSFFITVMTKKGFPVSFVLLVIGIVFVVYYFSQTFIFTHTKFHITPMSIFMLLFIGILSAIGNLFVYQAANIAPNAGLAIAIAGMQGVIVAIFAFIVFKDNLTTLQIIGIIFAVIAIFFINIGSHNTSHSSSSKVEKIKLVK